MLAAWVEVPTAALQSLGRRGLLQTAGIRGGCSEQSDALPHLASVCVSVCEHMLYEVLAPLDL